MLRWLVVGALALGAIVLMGCATRTRVAQDRPCSMCTRHYDASTKPVVAMQTARWGCFKDGAFIDCTAKAPGSCSDCVAMK